MLVGRELNLGLAVSGPDPRPANLDATAAERHLAVLVTVTHGGPLGVVLALRADHVVDLLFHQLGQYPEPNADAQRSSPSFAAPTNSPNASCTRSGSTASCMVACTTGTLCC